MFYRANPGLTSLPCSCKQIYAQNAAQELLREDECYDVYGHCRYSNVLHENKKDLISKVTGTANSFEVFNRLELHPCTTPIQTFQEISPWRACATMRSPHRACITISQNLSTSGNHQSADRDQVQRRWWTTSEAMINSKKRRKSNDGNEAVQPYSDSKLNESSRKSDHDAGFNTLRFDSSKSTLNEGFKFYHFKDFWKYTREYMNRVTIVKLQQQYNRISRTVGNSGVKSGRKNLSCEEASTHKKLEETKDQAKAKPSTNNELASKDLKKTNVRLSRNQTCFSFKFPSCKACSGKQPRCRTNVDRRKEIKPKTYKEKVSFEIQMLCQQLSYANLTKEDRKMRRQRNIKVIEN